MIVGKGSNASQYTLMQPIGAKAVCNYRPMTEDINFQLGLPNGAVHLIKEVKTNLSVDLKIKGANAK